MFAMFLVLAAAFGAYSYFHKPAPETPDAVKVEAATPVNTDERIEKYRPAPKQ